MRRTFCGYLVGRGFFPAAGFCGGRPMFRRGQDPALQPPEKQIPKARDAVRLTGTHTSRTIMSEFLCLLSLQISPCRPAAGGTLSQAAEHTGVKGQSFFAYFLCKESRGKEGTKKLLMSLRCAAKTYFKIHASGRSRGRMDKLCKFSTSWPS